ncbi:cation-translocating P-type ATPase [Acuticoccus mangrovi]|uniref:Cation-transporting P-type ATPase n=1 Tax=Acuticoccus mangrovi TaxID=2796142 RepID=A0A934MHY4_9HYPH|nr:cation-transporting P-type ATPase [Acuticoccus mangrovi]MBJ3776591.1 cation-transporting P-type ATPase [Acuticoccus mangrovi]
MDGNDFRRPCLSVRHHIPGRTRFNVAGWPDDTALDRAADVLPAHGMRLGSANPRTGSLLVLHRRSDAPAAIKALLEDLFGEEGAPGATGSDGVRQFGGCESVVALGVGATLAAVGSATGGLSEAEVERRLARTGANALPPSRGRSRGEILTQQFATIPVALLAGSAVLSLLTGGILDAVVTLGVVVLNAGIGFSSENATEGLIRRMSRPVEHDALVVRNGVSRRCSARGIVRGDIVLLAPGAFVPADARVIEARDLSVDESALTGESLPTVKSPGALAAGDVPLAERTNIVHAGTVVTGGDGRAVVVGTGRNTEIARIREMIGAAKPPKPHIEQKLGALTTQLTLGSVAICGLVLGVGLLRREPTSGLLKAVVALAVSAIPEGLPAVATSVLALGARSMEREGAFVRALPAVEAIGSVDTICLDKTGTLTENRMAVVTAWTAGRSWSGEGGRWAASDDAELMALAEAVSLCNEASLTHGTGSSTETALLRFADAVGVDHHKMRDVAPLTASRNRNHLRRWMATEHRRAGEAEVAVKGAPDEILALSATEFTASGSGRLDDVRRHEILTLNDGMARRGLRVLGVARRRGVMGEGALDDLEFLGLVALADPIRAEAREAVDVFHHAGVRTVMITGDQPATALAVAEALNLSRTGVLKVVEGSEIVGLDDAALGELALATSVFARVTPGDKLRIVRALQGAGRSVAMIGDGVNDGPALRAAAVGVAMGAASTDVAREVADIVVTDNLTGLARAIARGRTAEDNVRAAIRYLVSTNLSELLVMLVESLHGRGEMETPLELLWLNLATDVMPSLGLALAEPRGDVMLRPPRPTSAGLFDTGEVGEVALDAAGLATSALAAHFTMLARAGIGPRVRTATFLTLALGQIVHGLVLRDRSRTGGAAARLSERRLEAMLAAAAGVLAVPFVVPGLGRVLGIGRLTGGELALSLGLTATAFAVAEARHSRARPERTPSSSTQASPPARIS